MFFVSFLIFPIFRQLLRRFNTLSSKAVHALFREGNTLKGMTFHVRKQNCDEKDNVTELTRSELDDGNFSNLSLLIKLWFQ